MTRLFDAPHGKLHEFEKRLQAAGFTAEHLDALLKDQRRLRAWVTVLDHGAMPEPPASRITIKDVFVDGGRAPALLKDMRFVYLDEVAECTEEDFLELRNCGPKTLDVIVEMLTRHGFALRSTHDDPPPLVGSSSRYYRAYYRPRIGDVRLWSLLDFSFSDDIQNGHGTGDLTLQQFQDMGTAERERIFTPAGLHKVESFIARNGL